MSLITRILLIVYLVGIDVIYGKTLFQLDLLYFNYLASAAVGLFTVYSLQWFGISKLVRDIQVINIAWIVLHCYGFILYVAYLPSLTYAIMQDCLNIIMIGRILWVSHNDGLSDNDYWLDVLFNRWIKGLSIFNKMAKK